MEVMSDENYTEIAQRLLKGLETNFELFRILEGNYEAKLINVIEIS